MAFEKKSYAFVGASGCGKSTLLNLLQGYIDSYRGEVLIDGRELSSVKRDSLYEMISVIQQNVYIFNQSIKDNLTMFKNYEEDKLQKAIEQ